MIYTRITPAYAGKSKNAALERKLFKDHPRIRGEKFSAIAAIAAPVGSPPHTRGKADSWCAAYVSVGITPAYAGKSGCGVVGVRGKQDHPRIRGEKYCPRVVIFLALGSPPHTRGKATYTHTCLFGSGITPAYAGKRPCIIPHSMTSWDHPRIRGEKSFSAILTTVTWGSPPHTRGKAYDWQYIPAPPRITPAYAGKRTVSPSRLTEPEDHPRIRGEKWFHKACCNTA